jgi:hypothetical protein
MLAAAGTDDAVAELVEAARTLRATDPSVPG